MAEEITATQPQGMWSAAYSAGVLETINRRRELGLTVEIIRDVGQLSIDFGAWGADPIFAQCQYVFDATNLSSPTSALLNRAMIMADYCPTDFTLTFDKTGDDIAEMTFSNPDIIIPSAELYNIVRPFRVDDRRADVAGLDVLGINVGMNQTEAESLLEGLGFVVLEEEGRYQQAQDGSWRRDIVTYGREAGEPVGGGMGDKVMLTYSAVFADSPTSPVVISLRRHWWVHPDDGLTVPALEDALSTKFTGTTGNFANRYRWDRDGVAVTEETQESQCPIGTRQPVPTFGSSGNISLYCGPQVAIGLSGNRQTGLVADLRMEVIDPDILWEDFWTTWSAVRYAEIKTLYDGITATTGEAPEL